MQGDPRALIGVGVHVFTEETNNNKNEEICELNFFKTTSLCLIK